MVYHLKLQLHYFVPYITVVILYIFLITILILVALFYILISFIYMLILMVHILLYILNNSDQKFDMLPIWYHKFFSNSYCIYH